MDNKPLKISVGSLLQLQSATQENAPRYQVRVIGYLPGGSLVVTNPVVQKKLQIIREGTLFHVRMLSGSDVVGFTARTLNSAVKPYPHLHLEYPKTIESISVRNANRVSTRLPAKGNNLDLPDAPGNHPVSITDLSSTGCGLLASEKLGDSEHRLSLTFKIGVLDIAEEIQVKGTIKRISERPGNGKETQYFHGLAFVDLNRAQKIILHAWVLEQLMEIND
jgi:c-di-GMP-binding flagellar brake protein YcgR